MSNLPKPLKTYAAPNPKNLASPKQVFGMAAKKPPSQANAFKQAPLRVRRRST